MKKQGKIRAIPVTDPVRDKPVVYKGLVHLLIREGDNSGKGRWMLYKPVGNGSYVIRANEHDSDFEAFIPLTDLKQLVVEVPDIESRLTAYYADGLGNSAVIQYPLKYSQWQAAIDNGEVDGSKLVDFEISTRLAHDGTVIAKIIPQKKRVFTEEEMYMNMQYYVEYCSFKGYVTPEEWIKNHKCF